MSHSTFEKVAAFHDKFGFPYFADERTSGPPRVTEDEAFDIEVMRIMLENIRDVLRTRPDSMPHYRLGFIVEEVAELFASIAANDMVKIADALADIDYVATGMSHCYKIPHDIVVDEVHRSNMDKEIGRTERGSDTDVRKPDGWVAPKIADIVEFFRVEFRDAEAD